MVSNKNKSGEKVESRSSLQAAAGWGSNPWIDG